MKKEEITQNEFNQNNEILCFDPTTLKEYVDEHYGPIDPDDMNELDEMNEFDEWYDNYMKERDTTHIKKCYVNTDNIFIPNAIAKVYLAGKINKYDWRRPIVGYRCNGLMGGDNTNLYNYTVKYNDGVIITGPWFLACDHGCYHGDNSHGLGINNLGCPDGNGDNYTEKEVYNICISQIATSNIIFAYINDDTCYGTIYEIGYAKAKGRKIIIIFDNEKLMSKMWFMCQQADIVDTLGNMSIKEKFDEIMSKII